MKKIFLIGNLTADPQTRVTQAGKKVCNFNIAVNSNGRNGEKNTDFFRISAWNALADVCQKYLAKGKKVYVSGDLDAKIFDSQNGARIDLEVMANEVEFLSPRAEAVPDLSGFKEIEDEQLPF